MLIGLLRSKVGALFYFCRRIYFYPFFKSSNIIIGRNLSVRGWKGKNQFGENLVIYDNVIFESHNEDGQISIGKNCILSYGVIISCKHKIEIGNDVWIGEYSSIRDSTHKFSIALTLKDSIDYDMPIKIGNNVWIGKNCLIFPGSKIEDNVVIGANSIVKGNCVANSLYVGNPAYLKKKLF
jgi:acetyltransferase-like isoleucine patch superfamily enzyme